MKKALAIIIALVLIISVFAGCGNANSSSDAAPPADTGSAAPADTGSSAPPAESETVYNLTVHSHDPELGVTGDFLKAWAASIEEASGGRIKFTIYHGATLGGPKDALEMVSNGTCDIAWGLPSFYGGVFPASEVLMLPLLPIASTYQSSHVMWDLYKEVPEIQAEFEDYKVLLLAANTPSPVATRNFKIETVDDFAGINIRGNAGPPTAFIQNLGAAPVSIPITDVYQSIHNSTIDAVITDWNAFTQFQLYETCKYYLDEDIGVSSYFLVMNWDSYNNLPKDLQAIMDEYSGDHAIEYFYTYWDASYTQTRETVKARGDDIYKFSPEERAKFEAVAEKTINEWIAGAEAQGIPGTEIYNKLLEIIDRYSVAP